MSREDDEIQVLGEKTTSRKKIKKLSIMQLVRVLKRLKCFQKLKSSKKMALMYYF